MRYPKQHTANDLASYGRNGDTVLVHMNPVEVAGIAALSPNGLTTNPVTGQPEAFNLMQSAIPMLASYGGAAALSAATGGAATPFAMAMAGGLSSGLATGAMTQDWERGLYAGIAGAGMGAAVGAAGANAAGAVGAEQAVAGEGIAALGADAVVDPMANTVIAEAAEQELAQQALAQSTQQAAAEAGTGLQPFTGDMQASVVGPPAPPQPYTGTMQAQSTSMFGDPQMSNITADSYSQALKAPFQQDSQLMSEVMKPQAMLPMAMGMNQLAVMDADDAYNKDMEEKEGDSDEERRAAYARLQGAYRAAQPNARTGISPLRSGMSRNTPPPYRPPGMKAGGIATIKMGRGGSLRGWTAGLFKPKDQGGRNGNPADDGKLENAVKGRSGYLSNTRFLPTGLDSTMTSGPSPDRGYGMGEAAASRPGPDGQHYNAFAAPGAGQAGIVGPYGGGSGHYNGIDPVTVQSNLRGQFKVQPPQGFRPGFDPEFDYFQDDPENVYAAPPTDPNWQNQYQLFERVISDAQAAAEQSQTGGPLDQVPEGMADGGDVRLNTSAGEIGIEGGGIAGIQNDYTQPPMPEQPQPQQQDIMALAAALTGQAGQQSDMIIQDFVARFGADTFMALRDEILQSIGGQNAQTQGLIQGQGGGMDDQVMGTIGGQQPVAVSPGEYIVPADVVSGIGDGSTDAGAQELDSMMDGVRMARGGTTAQPQPFDFRKVMPR